MRLRATRLSAIAQGTRSSAPAWTPAQLTTALWLDAADTSTITLNGSTVSQWSDKSGNARNATQATAANQPAYSSPNITFADGSDVLTFGSNNASGTFGYGTGDFAILAVVNPTARVGTWGSEILTQHLFGARADFSFRILQDGRLVYGGTSAANIALSSATVALSVRSITAVTRASNTFQLYINGTANGVGTSTDSIGNGTGASIGNTFSGTTASFLNGAINEMIVVPTTLSADNRLNLEGYLAWKWGLQANLPVGHPYKDEPPTI
jgi:hypothetical protein